MRPPAPRPPPQLRDRRRRPGECLVPSDHRDPWLDQERPERGASVRSGVLVAFVLRLASDPLQRGEVVGFVEDVATGEQAPLRHETDLLRFLRQSAGPGRRRPWHDGEG